MFKALYGLVTFRWWPYNLIESIVVGFILLLSIAVIIGAVGRIERRTAVLANGATAEELRVVEPWPLSIMSGGVRITVGVVIIVISLFFLVQIVYAMLRPEVAHDGSPGIEGSRNSAANSAPSSQQCSAESEAG